MSKFWGNTPRKTTFFLTSDLNSYLGRSAPSSQSVLVGKPELRRERERERAQLGLRPDYRRVGVMTSQQEEDRRRRRGGYITWKGNPVAVSWHARCHRHFFGFRPSLFSLPFLRSSPFYYLSAPHPFCGQKGNGCSEGRSLDNNQSFLFRLTLEFCHASIQAN